MLRFALLRHDCPADYRDGPHWDLMLERPEASAERRLATWSLLRLPTAWGVALGLDSEREETVEAARLEDHRAVYLDKEGPLSGDRGSVTRIDGGPIEWLERSDDLQRVRMLAPSRLAGVCELSRRSGDEWRLAFTFDG